MRTVAEACATGDALIKGGTLYTMGEAGVVRADLRVRGGKIAEIGADLEPAGEGETLVDATDEVVTPGFVDAHSHIGGFDGDNEDLNELTNPRTPELDALFGIAPSSEYFGIALRQGITTSLIIPGSGNVIGGWGVVVKSAGRDGKVGAQLGERVLRHPAVLKAATGINPKGVYSKKQQLPMTRMGINYLLRSYLRDVRDYLAKKEAAAAAEAAGKPEGERAKAPEYDLGLEHGIPVLRREIPLKVHTYMHDMTQVVDIAREFDIEVTIDHAQGASDFYDELCDPHVRGVIFGPVNASIFPGEGGIIDYECLKGLDDRGVCVAVMTDGPVSIEGMLVYEMGEAVRMGMDPVRALAMVTSNAAHICGVEDRVGSLEVGKDGDVCVWSALPTLAADAVLERVLLEGHEVYAR